MLSQILTTLFNLSAIILYPVTLVLFLLIAVLVFWRKKVAKNLFVVAIIVFYFSANGLITKPLIHYLEKGQATINEDTITAHQAMIVLGGGLSHYPDEATPATASYARVLEAYRIYNIAQKHDVQYTIFLSGGGTKDINVSEAKLFKELLMQLGVPEQYLILESNSMNTYQNAEYLQPILDKYHFNRYLLVTSALHMKRAMDYFKHFNITTIAAPSDFPYPIISIVPNSYNLAFLRMAIHEYLGIMRLPIYNWLGLNRN